MDFTVASMARRQAATVQRVAGAFDPPVGRAEVVVAMRDLGAPLGAPDRPGLDPARDGVEVRALKRPLDLERGG